MIRVMKLFLTFFFFGVILYVLEGACFRLVEQYADFRLKYAWGEPGEGVFHPVLKKFGLDHFIERPKQSDYTEPHKYAEAESDYAKTVMSFARPLRDRYEDYVASEDRPLEDFEIRDFGKIRGLVLPGLKRPATMEEVTLKKARRVGDPLEYSEAILIRFLSSSQTEDYEAEFGFQERTFGFLLQNGIACMVRPVSSARDVMETISYLKKEHELLAQNIFAWGDGIAGTYLLEACRQKPGQFKAVLVANPAEIPAPPLFSGLPWMNFLVSEDLIPKDESLSRLLKWVRAGRDTESIYPSRLGGVMRIEENPAQESIMPSFFLSWLLQCSAYIENAGDQWPEAKPFPSDETQLDQSPREGNLTEGPFDLSTVEQTNQELSIPLGDGHSIYGTDPTFDCKMVRSYRQMHKDNPIIRAISNRDLILKLGRGFEKRGGDVLEQIRERDALFHRYYLSLKALEDSPLY